jgi:hypothetical protein
MRTRIFDVVFHLVCFLRAAKATRGKRLGRERPAPEVKRRAAPEHSGRKERPPTLAALRARAGAWPERHSGIALARRISVERLRRALQWAREPAPEICTGR